MACHLFLGGDREQLFEEQKLPEQPNTSSCVRLAQSPELSPCSCGRQGRNGGRRQQNLPPTQGLELFICLTRTDATQQSLELLLPWRGAATGMAQQSPRICCYCHHSRGWDIPEVTQKSGIWHMFAKYKPPYSRYTKWYSTSILSIFNLLPAKQINTIFWPSQKGKTQKSINIFHY